MATYTVTETGRTWAGTSYNRTTRRWRDGGPELAVTIHSDDSSGQPLSGLSDDDLLEVAATIPYSEREDVGHLADDAADEIDRRLSAMGEKVDAWDGEDAATLVRWLNDVDAYAKRATEALRYVPGRPYGYDFEREWYDVTSLGWHGPEPSSYREDTYACDKHGVMVVLVAGTTDDGWTTEEPKDDDEN